MCISPSPTATSPQGHFSLADNLYVYSCPDLSTAANFFCPQGSCWGRRGSTAWNFRGLLQAKCLGSWWRHSSFSPASSLRFHMKISLVFYKQSLIPLTDEIQITLTLNITQTVKTSVTVINIPIQDFLTWKIIYLLMVWLLGSNHSLFYFGYC